VSLLVETLTYAHVLLKSIKRKRGDITVKIFKELKNEVDILMV
jgi:hypothetical protein